MADQIKLNLGCGKEPLEGFHNLDKKNGWLWESGLPMYKDNSVDAITISHTLMYVEDKYMPTIFEELIRVLKPGGVVRVTEDSTDDPLSERYNGHPECVSLTSAAKTMSLMFMAGFKKAFKLKADSTLWEDKSLCQNYHGGEPKVFFVEGVK